jgi:hypothetical protein
MKKEGISKSEMAKRMNTSRSQLERLLDPDNPQRPPGDGSKGGGGGRQTHDNQPRGRARVLKRASCSKPSVVFNRSRRITRAVLSSPLRNRFAASSRSALAQDLVRSEPLRSPPAAIGPANRWRVFLIHCRQLMCKASRSRNINRKITTTASHSRIEFRNWRDGLRAVGVGASTSIGEDLAGSPTDVAVTAKAKPTAAPANATTIPAAPDHFPLLYLPRL